MNAAVEDLHYPFSEPPALGTPLEVMPGIYWLRMPLPFALDHINLWLLRDGPGWTIIDCGIGLAPTRELWQRVFDGLLAGSHVTQLIVTHHHPDHVGNAAWLSERWNVPVKMTSSEFLFAHVLLAGVGSWNKTTNLAMYQQHGVDAAMIERQRQRGNSYAQIVPQLPPTHQRLIGGDRVVINGASWEIIIGYGHAPEHAALYCAQLGVLISGDQVLPRITTNVSVWPDQPDGNPLGLFLNSMRAYETLPASTLVLPSHDRIFRGLHARLALLREHHQHRLQDVKQACAQPRTAAEIVPVLFKRRLDDHQFMFAIGETLAHLNYLWHDGALTRIDAGTGAYQFVSRH